MSDKEDQQLDLGFIDDLETAETYKEKAGMFAELWLWVEKNIYRTNVLKGWTLKERKEGELIALIHSEISEALEALRRGNPMSKKVPEITHAEEEIADAIIRIMDMSFNNKWNLPRAIFLKMEYNKSRPYRHGGKHF